MGKGPILGRKRPPIAAISILAGSTGLRLSVLGVAFVTSVVASRALGPEGRGLYQVWLGWGALVCGVGGLSVEQALARRWSSDPDRRAELAPILVLGPATLGVVVGLIGFFLAFLVPGAVPVQPLFGLTLACAMIPFILARTWTQRLLLLRGRPIVASVLSLCGSLATLIALIVSQLCGSLTAVNAVGFTLLGAIVELVIAYAVVRPFSRPSWQVFRTLLVSGLKFHPGQISLSLLVKLDVLFLSAWAGLSQVGLYSVAVSVATPLSVFAAAITTTFLHKQFQGNDDSAATQTGRLVGLTLAVLLPLATLIAAIAWFFVPVVWGEDFAEAVVPLLFLLPGALAVSMQRPVGNFFVRLGWHKAINFRSFVSLAVNITACILLIPSLGSVGAAIASSSAYIVYLAISLTVFFRSTGLGITDILPPWSLMMSRARAVLPPLGRGR